MNRADAEIRLRADTTRAIASIQSARKDLTIIGILRAVRVARHNGYAPVRLVVGHRLARTLGLIKGMDVKLLGEVPVVVDEDAADGFGLVTRPPGP